MDNVRLRRLKADYEALRRLARLHPKIDIEGVVGNPPERYRIRLTVKSLREKGEAIETATEHWLEVSMPRGYPRDAPLFRMLTPVFHPNIAPHAVCIGDDWTAGEPIEHLIQRVGEILAFQSYNTRARSTAAPRNGSTNTATSCPSIVRSSSSTCRPSRRRCPTPPRRSRARTAAPRPSRWRPARTSTACARTARSRARPAAR